MNTELFNAVKQIVAKDGESILLEPNRISAFLADLAKDVPKPQKNALIKCLEYGFVKILKDAEEEDRASIRQKLAQRLKEDEGFDLELCTEAVNLLGTVLFGEEEYNDIPVTINKPTATVPNTTIPYRFTDQYVHGQIAKVESEIADCDAKISKAKTEISKCQTYERDWANKAAAEYQRVYNEQISIWGTDEYARKEARENARDRSRYLSENADVFRQDINRLQEEVNQLTAKKAECEAKKRELAPLARLSCLDRMELVYKQLVNAMQQATEEELPNLAKQFRELEGYKDSAQLADECEKKVRTLKEQREAKEAAEIEAKNQKNYDGAIAELNRLKNQTYANSADYSKAMQSYDALIASFKSLSTYKNTDDYVKECQNNRKDCETKYTEVKRKEEYDKAVSIFQYLSNQNYTLENEYKKASEDYSSLASTLQDFGDYENAKSFIEQCRAKQSDYKALYDKAADDRRKRYAIETKRNRRRKKLEKVAPFIYPLVIGGIIGGIVLSILSSSGDLLEGEAVGFIYLAPILFFAILGGKGFGWPGAIAGIAIGFISLIGFVASIYYLPFLANIAIGVIGGAVIGAVVRAVIRKIRGYRW